MPLYEYQCRTCGTSLDEFHSIDDCETFAPYCPCGRQMTIKIGGYKVHGDLQPYYDENLEVHITSKRHRRQVMKEQGVEEHYGQGWWTSPVKKRTRR